MTKQLDIARMSLNQLARRKCVQNGSVTFWVGQGCPRNKDKTFNLKSVEAWLKQSKEAKVKSKDLREEKLKQEITRIKRDISQRDLALQRDKGEVHSKSDCAASLVEVRAAESRIIGTLDKSFKGAFPEASPAMTEWLAKWARETLSRLNGGEA